MSNNCVHIFSALKSQERIWSVWPVAEMGRQIVWKIENATFFLQKSQIGRLEYCAYGINYCTYLHFRLFYPYTENAKIHEFCNSIILFCQRKFPDLHASPMVAITEAGCNLGQWHKTPRNGNTCLQCIKSDPSVIMWDTNMNCVLETSTEYSHWRQFGITLTRRLLYYLACSLKHSTQGTLSKSYNQCVRPKLIPVWRKQSARICSRLHYFTYSQFSCAFCTANHYGKYLISWHLGINQSY